jgi:hypothetical protein
VDKAAENCEIRWRVVLRVVAKEDGGEEGAIDLGSLCHAGCNSTSHIDRSGRSECYHFRIHNFFGRPKVRGVLVSPKPCWTTMSYRDHRILNNLKALTVQ